LCSLQRVTLHFQQQIRLATDDVQISSEFDDAGDISPQRAHYSINCGIGKVAHSIFHIPNFLHIRVENELLHIIADKTAGWTITRYVSVNTLYYQKQSPKPLSISVICK
jgi:hypothetical protein